MGYIHRLPLADGEYEEALRAWFSSRTVVHSSSYNNNNNSNNINNIVTLDKLAGRKDQELSKNGENSSMTDREEILVARPFKEK
jgi:hypothetical protein